MVACLFGVLEHWSVGALFSFSHYSVIPSLHYSIVSLWQTPSFWGKIKGWYSGPGFFIEFLKDTGAEWHQEPAEGIMLSPLEVHEIPAYA